MKKIINGKKYDTDTAEQISCYWNGLGDSDFQHVEESLYKKTTGEFFLYGKGGPLSKYAVSCGNSTSGSKEIIPLSIAEAKEWLAENETAARYEEVFGEVAE